MVLKVGTCQVTPRPASYIASQAGSIYAGYLFFFQGLYRLGNLYHSVRLTLREGAQQLEPYRAALGDEKVTELSAPLEAKKKHFYFTFYVTLALLALITAGVALAGALLPGMP